MTTRKKIIVGIAVAGGIVFVVFNLYIMFGYGYESRARITEAMVAAQPMRDSVMAFRVAQGRWPEAPDAGRFRADPAKLGDARSIVYDSARKGVVITMGRSPYEGQSFVFVGEDRDGAPQWTCRTIDMPTKYLPAACR